MAFPLTEEQQKIVTDRGGELLVSAAAGCGKTSVSGADHNGIIFWHQYLLLDLW